MAQVQAATPSSSSISLSSSASNVTSDVFYITSPLGLNLAVTQWTRTQAGTSAPGPIHERPGRAAIMCHGMGVHRQWEWYPLMCRALLSSCECLTHAYAIDFAGNGDSQGELKFSNYLEEVEDLRTLIMHLKQQHIQTHTIIGHSKGAGVVLVYASQYADVPTVINVCGRYDMSRGLRFTDEQLQECEQKGSFQFKVLGRDMCITRSCLTVRRNMSMSCVSSIPRTISVLTLHGTNDTVIPVEDAYSFDRLIPNHTLITLDGADHLLIKWADQVIQHAITFINTTILNSTTTIMSTTTPTLNT